MSNSFAEQLANVKLKPSKDKTKDFSDPKLAIFNLCFACEKTPEMLLLSIKFATNYMLIK
jgi:hypothetical protein